MTNQVNNTSFNRKFIVKATDITNDEKRIIGAII